MKVYNRYAHTLFELALENDVIDLVCDELSQISKILKDNTEFFNILIAPNIPQIEKIALIDNIFLGKCNELTLNFLKTLAENDRINIIFNIISEFKSIILDHNDEVKVIFTTAIDLDESTKLELIKKVEEKITKKVIPFFIIDPKILGGVIMSYNNTLIDGSIKTKLLNLNKHIGK